MTEKEKALAGLEFVRGDKDLKARRERAELLCFQLNTTAPTDTQKRQEILSQLISSAGEGCYIKPPFICEYGDFITLGKNFFANYNCKLMDGGRITFGDDVLIGPDCTFVTAQHPVDPARRLAGYQIFKPNTGIFKLFCNEYNQPKISFNQCISDLGFLNLAALIKSI